LNVLLSAYACMPGRGSEPGIGWNWVRQAARFHDVWVLTHDEGRRVTESALAVRPIPRARFIYLDLPAWARFWKKGRRGAQLHYYLWQIGAYFKGRRLHREVGFDLVHHVTLGKYWMPSFLALLPVPFIWGPVGGGESTPRAFRSSFSLRGRLYELARDIARKLGECDPFVRQTARKAVLGLATTEETAKRMRALGCKRVSVLSQVGLCREEIRLLAGLPLRQTTPFRLLSTGRLLHWKGFELGLRAFAEFHRYFPTSEYWFAGDGPDRKRLAKLARNLGVTDKVRFWGWLPRQETLAKLAECDVLVHPSLHESGGYVCLEAMAAGRPVICLDLGGPALLVSEETGIKIPAISPEQAVRALADAMLKLATDPDLRARMAQAARQRVKEHFSWDRKAILMMEIYRKIANTDTTIIETHPSDALVS